MMAIDKETERDLKELLIEREIEKGISKWLRTVCVTATSTLTGFFLWLGSFIYDKFDAVEAAVKAFIAAGRHGQ